MPPCSVTNKSCLWVEGVVMFERAEDDVHGFAHRGTGEDFAAFAVALESFAEDPDDQVVLEGYHGREGQGRTRLR